MSRLFVKIFGTAGPYPEAEEYMICQLFNLKLILSNIPDCKIISLVLGDDVQMYQV